MAHLRVSGSCLECGTLHGAEDSCPTLIRGPGGTSPIPLVQGVGPSEDPLLGQALGNYRLIRLLGEGAFARVYLAEHAVMGGRFAVKVMHPSAAQDEELVRRFIAEARATNAVRHPNIVQISDINVMAGNRHYIVMEYLDGVTLQSAISGRHLSFEEAAPIALQLCDALQAVHAQGVVHRDLKPENIYLVKGEGEGQRQVKIVDFGIARREQLGVGESRTAFGMVMGTPQYMSPEQAAGKPVDGRSDLYSLGILLFRMATGKLPFDGSVAELLLAHTLYPPPMPTSLNPAIDARYQDIILKALAKSPDERFQTAAELAQAIRALGTQPTAPADPARSVPVLSAEAVEALVDRVEGAAEDDHYRMLGLPEDAELTAVQKAANRSVDALSGGPATAIEARRIERCTLRIRTSAQVLTDPFLRAAYDADRGNFRGVARCIEAGLSDEALVKLRDQFLGSRPALLAILKPVLRQLAAVEKQGSPSLLKDALETALRLDPLDPAMHRRYRALP